MVWRNMPEYKIPELVRMLEEGEIQIPELQREFVWSDNQVRDLAESIYKGYPIGTMIFYKVPSDLREGRERFWVLDGQQRLLSLALMVKGKVLAVKGGEIKAVKLDVWFDPKNDSFMLRSPRLGENWIKLSELIQLQRRADLENLLRQKMFNPEEQERISTLWGIFRNDFKVLMYEISEDLDLDDLGNIFVRTNFAGTRVKGSDVYSTMIAVTYRGLVKQLRDICAKLPIEIDYGILIRTFTAFITDGKIKLASRVLDQAIKLKKIFDEKKLEINDIVSRLESCVSDVASILKEAGITHLPTENVLPVMAYYVYKRGRLSQDEKDGIIKWFILASFFKRYSASVETRLDEDLAVIKNGGNYKDLIKNIALWEGDLQERIKGYIASGYWDRLLVYLLLKQSNAKDFFTGEIISFENSVVHHIFPRKHLAASKYEPLLNDIGNITLITYQSNQQIQDELPENYLPKVDSETRIAHCIPEDKECWKFENIEKFIEQRRNLLNSSVERLFKDL